MKLIIVFSLFVAVSLSLFWFILIILAMPNNWKITLNFNAVGEAHFEIYLMFVVFMITLIAVYKYFKEV